MSPTSAPVVRLTGLSKSYGPVHAVRDLDLRIERGEVVALLGPNGAGKSTTLDLLLGLQEPDRGSVAILGRTPHDAIAEGSVGAMLQAGGLIRDLDVRELVDLVASLYPHALDVDEVLARTGLTDIAGQRTQKLSGGQAQRVRFALALVSDPALLVLDEPTVAMDVSARAAFWSSLRELGGGGRTVVFATHYLEEADQYADRIVLISHGRIVADGTGSQIKALASGRTVRATLPDADTGALTALDGVTGVEVRGDSVLVHTRDSDSVARHLLTQTSARDLEITSHGLEDAFITLTGDAR